MRKVFGLFALPLVAACYRPAARTGALAGALAMPTTASVREAAVAARAAFSHFDIPLELFLPDSAVVESGWLDIATIRHEAESYPPDQRVVRFRVLILPDSAGRATRIFVEALEQTEVNRRVGSKGRGRLVPRDHPAMAMARELLERVRDELQ
ncbi:MAG: hypothetical protein A3I79_03315 [Gemmatimonadetes bacterium RIFCSPLOWO2_02_FULL_71_11]|nr:MAG: hypothetical protein A3I79_03315 [Gemmatimonadetes bacterium RIFCSPLOWO2_02_FULL_71_11]